MSETRDSRGPSLTAAQVALLERACGLRKRWVQSTKFAAHRVGTSRAQTWRLERAPEKSTLSAADRYVLALTELLSEAEKDARDAGHQLRLDWQRSLTSPETGSHVGARTARLLSQLGLSARQLATTAGVSPRAAQRFLQRGAVTPSALCVLDALVLLSGGDAQAVAIRDLVRASGPKAESADSDVGRTAPAHGACPFWVVSSASSLRLVAANAEFDLASLPIAQTWNPRRLVPQTPSPAIAWRRVVADAAATGVRPHVQVDASSQSRWIEPALRDPLAPERTTELLPALRLLPERSGTGPCTESVYVRFDGQSNASDEPAPPGFLAVETLCTQMAMECASAGWTLRVDLDDCPSLRHDALVIVVAGAGIEAPRSVSDILSRCSAASPLQVVEPCGLLVCLAAGPCPPRGWSLSTGLRQQVSALDAGIVALTSDPPTSATALFSATKAFVFGEALEAALRTSDALLDAQGGRSALVWWAPTRETRRQTPTTRSRLRRPNLLVGRTALLRRSLETLQRSDGFGLALTGPGGIGKSAVAAELAYHLAPRWHALSVAAGGRSTLEVVQLLVDLHRSRCDALLTWAVPRERTSAVALLHAWAAARAKAGTTPVLVLLEDLHVDDAETHELLQTWNECANLDRLILTVRREPGTAPVQLPPVFAEANLAGLDARHAVLLARLRAARLGQPMALQSREAAARLAACGGNPRLLELMATAPQTTTTGNFGFTPAAPFGGPRTLEDAERLRNQLLEVTLASASTACRTALAELSFVTAPIPLTVLSAIAEALTPKLPPQTLVDQLVHDGWLHAVPTETDEATFVQHPWTREGVRLTLAAQGVRTDTVSQRAAHAWNAFAHEHAVASPAVALVAWQHARDAALRGTDVALADRTLTDLRRTLQILGRVPEAASLLDELASARHPASTRCRAMLERAMLALVKSDVGTANRDLDEVAAWLDTSPEEDLTSLRPALLAARAYVALRQGRPAEALAGWLAAADANGAGADPIASFTWRNNAATCHLRLRDVDAARAQFERARAFASEEGIAQNADVQRQLTMLELTLLRDEGRFQEAGELASTCLDDATRSRRMGHRLWLLGLLSSTQVGQQKWKEAMDSATRQYQESLNAGVAATARNAAAKARAIARRLQDPAAAKLWQERFWDRLGDAPDRSEELYGLLEDARRARMVNDLYGWRTAIAQLTALADDDQAPDILAMLAEQHAQLAERAGNLDAAAEWRAKIPPALRLLPDWED